MDEMPDIAGDITVSHNALDERLPDETPTPVSDGDSVSLGIESLNRVFDGGVPSGSLVVIEFPADSSGEELGVAIAGEGDHSTLYVSLTRPASLVNHDIARMGNSPNASVVYMGDKTANPNDAGWLTELHEYGEEWLGCSLVLDTYTDYALQFSESRQALTGVAERVHEHDGLVCLLVHEPQSTPEAEIARRAKHLADIVIEYQKSKTSDDTDNILISKMRRRKHASLNLPRYLDLDLEEDLSVSHDSSF